MKKLAVAIAIACCSTLVLADDTTQGTTDTSGKASAQGAGDTMTAKAFWDKNAKDGYLSKEDAARFKGADGKSVDMQKLDIDNDGRISEREWTMYNKTAGAAGKSQTGSTAPQTGK
jgi:hypothetical protein